MRYESDVKMKSIWFCRELNDDSNGKNIESNGQKMTEL